MNASNAVDAAAAGQSFDGDLSIIALFMHADIIVKAVALILVFASVWCWAIIFEKKATLGKLNRRANKFEDAFWSGEPLDKLYQRIKKSPHDPLLKTFSAGMEEWQNTVSGGVPDRDNLQASLRQRVERAMSVAISREMVRLERGMTFLATVGSTAPFIGLFGTVWGIMNSFNSIAHSNNTSLAVVAPGISEALFVTALGLVAAIPSVIAYNGYSSKLDRYAGRLDAFVTEFSAILSRHLESSDSNGGRSKKVA
ncbi:MAG: protein TolQ [Micavibrio aeruginosavorus]|uniref:Protein TolQ n=1 Tax=Micavibrio aeruginosavorus TaxID=349221 RepID=A0A2W5MTQ0_9BACT|nr:MAG: protein TolQ [Micavibrio aeruginosavorus]